MPPLPFPLALPGGVMDRSTAIASTVLNPSQREAVDATLGPLRIMAGAGTGKTFTLTERTAGLVRSGMAGPDQILALTFTTKAAEELRERIGKVVALLPGTEGRAV